MRIDCPGRTHRSSHQVWSDQCPRDRHGCGQMLEGPYVDDDRGDARLLNCPRNVSDRHVTNRSGGDEQADVDSLRSQPPSPPGRDLVSQPQLGCRSHKRVVLSASPAYYALACEIVQSS